MVNIEILQEIVKAIDTCKRSDIDQLKQYFDDQLENLRNGYRGLIDGQYLYYLQDSLEAITASHHKFIELAKSYGVQEFHEEFGYLRQDVENLKSILEFSEDFKKIQDITIDQIKEKYQESGLVLKNIADHFSVSLTTAHDWMTGKRNISIPQKIAIMNFFDEKIKSNATKNKHGEGKS